ncbi:helix-turn-helix domain-containing protein [Streptomyces shenzhenensis]|uniref:helix-turn-helix domain-containing protein n=1 Tax=Streptomyces shenzhenensis TaxID=943815 RepID=UPI001F2C321F|nr:helix-turn-helix transcriptional regulator [Streptomyces shenzhenensis]
MTEDKKNPLGPTGERLRHAIARVREARGMSKKELSDRVAALGRPIPPLGISRLEAGTRRIDADDLVALAFALRVNVNALLLPTDGDGTEKVDLTDQVSLTAADAWQWADGDKPHATTERDKYGQVLRFRLDSRPEWDRDPIRKMYNAVLRETSDRNALAGQSGTFSVEDGQLVLRADDGREVQRFGPEKES